MFGNITEVLNTVISNINESVGIDITNPYLLIKYVSMLFEVDTSKIEDKLFTKEYEDDIMLDEYEVEFGPHVVYNLNNNLFYYLYSLFDGIPKDVSIIIIVNRQCFKVLYEGIPPSYGYKLNVDIVEDIFSIVGKKDILNSYGIFDGSISSLYSDIFVQQSVTETGSTVNIRLYGYVLPDITEDCLFRNIDKIVTALETLNKQDEKD